MKHISVWLLCLLVAGLCATGAMAQGKAAAPSSNAADVKALRDADAAFEKACSSKDLEKCVNFYADNAVLLEPGAPMKTGKAAIHEMWKTMLTTPGMSVAWQATHVDVARSGDLGYTVGLVTLTSTGAAGKPVATKAKYLTVWKKMADGSWKVVADTYNEDSPPPSPPAPPKKRQ